MQFGWQGLIRTIVLTAVVTSAFWVLAGVWWMNRLPSGTTRPAAVADAGGIAAPGAGSVRAPAPGAGLLIPVVGIGPGDLADTFSQARAGGERQHDAIDIMAPLGSPVVAVADGMVEKLFVSKDGGNTVYQRSSDGRMIYYYAHLDRYAAGLAEGQMLKRGSAIGTVGYSGNANPAAPHLHFAVMHTRPAARWHEAATAVNPYPMLVGRAKPAHRSGQDQLETAAR